MSVPPLELRDIGGGMLKLQGWASVTDTPYQVGSYTETIRRGAFARSLSNQALDVVLLSEHQGLPLARTTSGTMSLSEDAIGLRVAADLDPHDPDVQAIASKIRRGDLTEMSFAFRAVRQTWSDDYSRREISEVEVHRGDVSLVSRGASPSTSVSLRTGDLSLEERRARAEGLGQRFFGCGSVSLSKVRRGPVEADRARDRDSDRIRREGDVLVATLRRLAEDARASDAAARERQRRYDDGAEDRLRRALAERRVERAEERRRRRAYPPPR